MIEGAFLHVLDGMSFLRPFARGGALVHISRRIRLQVYTPGTRGAGRAGCGVSGGVNFEEIERPWRAAARRAMRCVT